VTIARCHRRPGWRSGWSSDPDPPIHDSYHPGWQWAGYRDLRRVPAAGLPRSQASIPVGSATWAVLASVATYPVVMCRNITELRGLEPAATDEEIEAASRQYVRKVSGIQALSDSNRDAFEVAVSEVTAATARLLDTLPARKQPPSTIPPLRRPEVRARIAARQAAQAAANK